MPHRDQTNIGRAIKKKSTNGTNSTSNATTVIHYGNSNYCTNYYWSISTSIDDRLKRTLDMDPERSKYSMSIAIGYIAGIVWGGRTATILWDPRE